MSANQWQKKRPELEYLSILEIRFSCGSKSEGPRALVLEKISSKEERPLH